MTKVVSIALFGENADKYAVYVRALIRGHLNLFPLDEDWKLAIHVDSATAKTATGALIRSYANAGLCESVLMYPNATTRTPPLCKAMLWRMAPVFSRGVDYVFCRDLDSPPMPRDRACCEDFMVSSAAIGTIHDNLMHTGIMGGLCHFNTLQFCRQTAFQGLEDIYRFAHMSDAQWARHGADQEVLNRLLVARPALTLLEHRYSGWWAGPGKHPSRMAGEYACEAWSAKVPDQGPPWCMRRGGESDRPASVYFSQADRLGNHLGAAGYDHEAAAKFWDDFGDPALRERIAHCESAQ